MNAVTVSLIYQVAIPRSVRESLGIKPGQKVQLIQYENRVELIPLKPINKREAFLKASKPRSSEKRSLMHVVDSSGWLSLKPSATIFPKWNK